MRPLATTAELPLSLPSVNHGITAPPDHIIKKYTYIYTVVPDETTNDEKFL